jgi:hypothetical protein
VIRLAIERAVGRNTDFAWPLAKQDVFDTGADSEIANLSGSIGREEKYVGRKRGTASPSSASEYTIWKTDMIQRGNRSVTKELNA